MSNFKICVIEPFNFRTSDLYCGIKGFCLQVSIMDTKLDIEKFTRDNNFRLGKVNIKASLTQRMCIEAFKGKKLMFTCLKQIEKTKMMDNCRSVIIL